MEHSHGVYKLSCLSLHLFIAKKGLFFFFLVKLNNGYLRLSFNMCCTFLELACIHPFTNSVLQHISYFKIQIMSHFPEISYITHSCGLFHSTRIAGEYYINMSKISVLGDKPSKIGRSCLIEFYSSPRSLRYKLLGALLKTCERFCPLSIVMNFPL